MKMIKQVNQMALKRKNRKKKDEKTEGKNVSNKGSQENSETKN